MAARFAAAYLRRSSATPDVVDPATGAIIRKGSPGDASDDAQRAACRNLAQAFAPSAELREFRDWGVSGRKDDRKQYVELKAAIARDEVCCVFALALDRLGRSTKELLEFFALCRAHNTTVTTERDGKLGTESPTGEFLLTMLAALAQLESGLARERSAKSREARQERYAAADALLSDGKVPGGPKPMYGFVHQTTNEGAGRIIRRQHDPEHPVQVLIDAYREAGTGRGAIALLNAPAGEVVTSGKTGEVIGIGKGIPAPAGGQALWSSGTILRVLRAHADCDPAEHDHVELPDRSATGKALRQSHKPALFRGLVRCHCGALMTPNIAHQSLYCSRGRNQGVELHGRYNIGEKELKAALWSEVSRQYRAGPKPIFKERSERAIADLEARRERVAAARLDGLITATKAKAETEAIDARLDKLNRQAGAWTGMFAGETVLDLNDPDVAAQNALLRRLWLRVTLDSDYRPSVEWVIDPDKARAEELAMEAAYNEPDETGESQHDREYTAEMVARHGTPERVNAALRKTRRATVASAPAGATETASANGDGG